MSKESNLVFTNFFPYDWHLVLNQTACSKNFYSEKQMIFFSRFSKKKSLCSLLRWYNDFLFSFFIRNLVKYWQIQQKFGNVFSTKQFLYSLDHLGPDSRRWESFHWSKHWGYKARGTSIIMLQGKVCESPNMFSCTHTFPELQHPGHIFKSNILTK
jgi:hypothetical protein